MQIWLVSARLKKKNLVFPPSILSQGTEQTPRGSAKLVHLPCAEGSSGILWQATGGTSQRSGESHVDSRRASETKIPRLVTRTPLRNVGMGKSCYPSTWRTLGEDTLSFITSIFEKKNPGGMRGGTGSMYMLCNREWVKHEGNASYDCYFCFFSCRTEVHENVLLTRKKE